MRSLSKISAELGSFRYSHLPPVPDRLTVPKSSGSCSGATPIGRQCRSEGFRRSRRRASMVKPRDWRLGGISTEAGADLATCAVKERLLPLV